MHSVSLCTCVEEACLYLTEYNALNCSTSLLSSWVKKKQLGRDSSHVSGGLEPKMRTVWDRPEKLGGKSKLNIDKTGVQTAPCILRKLGSDRPFDV